MTRKQLCGCSCQSPLCAAVLQPHGRQGHGQPAELEALSTALPPGLEALPHGPGGALMGARGAPTRPGGAPTWARGAPTGPGHIPIGPGGPPTGPGGALMGPGHIPTVPGGAPTWAGGPSTAAALARARAPSGATRDTTPCAHAGKPVPSAPLREALLLRFRPAPCGDGLRLLLFTSD